MKSIFTLTGKVINRLAGYTLTVPFIILFSSAANAQMGISNVYTHWTSGTTTTYSGTGATGNFGSGLTGNTYNYQYGAIVASNNTQLLDSFSTLLGMFKFQGGTPKVRFRRVNNSTVTGLRKSLWFQQNSATTVNANGTIALVPPYDDSLERIFGTGQVFNIGIDNDFQNSNITNNNNIERVDQIISGGTKATDATKAGFAVFDRGTAGGNDSFYIAAIKTLDANGDPDSYYNPVLVKPGNYGTSTTSTYIPYIILRKNPADAHLLMMNNSTSQDREGVLVTYNSLGVGNNSVIYGYSLFAPDLPTTATAADLVDFTNTTYFPITTAPSGGGLDQVAITGIWATNASYVVLPDWVDGLSARVSGSEVWLSWQLKMTDGLREVIVERSANGVDFTSLINDHSPQVGLQADFDAHPLQGINYYRLKLLDNNGVVVAYSNISPVMMNAPATADMNIYSNPVANGRFTLSAQGLKSETYDLRVVDLNGHELVRQQLMGAPSLSTVVVLPNGTPSGMYMVKLVDGHGGGGMVKEVMVR